MARPDLRTLIRVTRAVADATRDPRPAPGRPPEGAAAGGLGGTARRAAGTVADTVRRDPRVQDAADTVRGRVRDLRTAAQDRADAHLERLLAESHARRGTAPSAEVAESLARRREERDARARAAQARAALLAQAHTPEQRRVLTRVADHTPDLGGTLPDALRYTALLDALVPGGGAAEEMAVHRALWTLAERRVLAVSRHGEVTACPVIEMDLGRQITPG